MKQHARPLRVLMCPWFDENPYQTLLANGLRNSGVEVDGRSAARFLSSAAFSGADVYHLHWLHSFYLSKRGIKRLWNVIAFTLQLLIARARHKRIVWTVHNLLDHESKHPYLDRYCTWLVTHLATAIIVHCDWSKQQLLASFPKLANTRIHLIPHGNYIGVYPEPGTDQAEPDHARRQAARSALGIDETATVILFFGNIRPYKGVPELIEAYSALPASSNCQLIIAGKPFDDNDNARIRAACAGLPVHLQLRSIDDAELPVFFHAADYQVLPYHHIATSGAAILGMSFARALIAPRIGCLTENLRTAGAVLYDATDSNGLGQALAEAVARRPEASEMGVRNLDIAEQWNWKSIAAQTCDAYR